MILRSMLYTPGNSLRLITRGATLPIDAVILDLEDAVPLAEKETARLMARDSMKLFSHGGAYVFVRVNSMASGLTEDDLKVIVAKELDGVVLAKTESGSEVKDLEKMLKEVEDRSGLARGSVKIVPLIESARGVNNTHEIASGSERVEAVAFGAGDYYRDLGGDVAALSFEETELLYARSHIVNASRAAQVQAIDTPYLGLLTDRERFLNEVRMAVQMGFTGKQCIHPSQIGPVNDAFSPAGEKVTYAARLVDVFEEAERKGMGAISFEGKMIDRMSFLQARDVLSKKAAMTEKEEKRQGVSGISIKEIFT